MTTDPSSDDNSSLDPPLAARAAGEPSEATRDERSPAATGAVPAEVDAAEIVEAEMIAAVPIVADVIDAVAIVDPVAAKVKPPRADVPPTLPHPHHVGSPFAEDSRQAGASLAYVESTEPYTARGAAMASLALGLLGLAAAWFSMLSSIPAVLGLGMGLWGVSSRFRRRAWVGVGLSLLAFALALSMAFIRPLLFQA